MNLNIIDHKKTWWALGYGKDVNIWVKEENVPFKINEDIMGKLFEFMGLEVKIRGWYRLPDGIVHIVGEEIGGELKVE